MLVKCWASVVDDGPKLNQHRVNISCFDRSQSLRTPCYKTADVLPFTTRGRYSRIKTGAWSVLNQRLSLEIYILLSLSVFAPGTPRCCREIDPPRQYIQDRAVTGCDVEGGISLRVTDLWVLHNTDTRRYVAALYMYTGAKFLRTLQLPNLKSCIYLHIF